MPRKTANAGEDKRRLKADMVSNVAAQQRAGNGSGKDAGLVERHGVGVALIWASVAATS